MPQFLIEVSHEAERIACARAIKAFLELGSHFANNADWGCRDGDHRAWVKVEANTKEEARAIVPPIYRSQSKITELNKFSLQEIEAMLQEHQQ